ncbi:MAG: AAA family ATPase [Oscillospiraceae bacterium]|nr:AAA family ATPase [Oscillospiraceae bacterium]
MKIKLAILDRDKTYLMRMVSTFGVKYADKLELYSFTDADNAVRTVTDARIDVLLSGDTDFDCSRLPSRCAFAYLVDSMGIDSLKEQQAICKFQKGDLIYKQILGVYSEKASTITGFSSDGDSGAVIAFCSASGGVGSSTMAAACAVHFAMQKKKTLYLNLEKFGSAELFFSGPGQSDMSDVIFALKSKKTNLALKLTGCVKQDETGVFFFDQTKIALDMLELTTEDVLRLISELKLMGEYDYIILDLDFALDRESLSVLRQAQSIILVGDGSAASNLKTQRAYAALTELERNQDAPLTNRLTFAYNKVSSKNGASLNVAGLRVLGGAPVYSGATARQLIGELASLKAFDEVL